MSLTRFWRLCQGVEDGDDSAADSLPELHATCAGLKAVCTTWAAALIEDSRKCCGVSTQTTTLSRYPSYRISALRSCGLQSGGVFVGSGPGLPSVLRYRRPLHQLHKQRPSPSLDTRVGMAVPASGIADLSTGYVSSV